MDIRLIALDLDGTLLNQEKELSPRNQEALERCIQLGIHIVPATGRPALGLPGVIRNMPGVRYGILTNGARVEDMVSGELISEARIDWQLASRVLTFVSQHPVAYDPYISGRGRMEARFLNHLEEYGLLPAMKKLVLSTRDEVENAIAYVEERKEDVEKINIFTPDQKLRCWLWEKLSQYPELIVTSSLEYNLEINAASATKGRALSKLAEFLDIPIKQTMAFGDGSNDLSMIQTAGVGVAMANGMDGVKEKADYITLSNEEDGVAAAIHHFLGI